MPEFSSFGQWLGWAIILFLVCVTLESVLVAWARAWAARGGRK